METMLDKITGKKRPESDETATERPEGTHGPSGNGEEENVVGDENDTQLQNELENLKKTYELMLADDYESVKDASGAGHSPKKQEGNVHGYEQVEGVVSSGKTNLLTDESENNWVFVEEVKVEVLGYERGKELSGNTQKVDIELFVYGLDYSMLNKEAIFNLTIRAWISKSKFYSFYVEEVRGILKKNKKSKNYSIIITESFIVRGDGVS